MDNFPILSLITYLPLVGALVIFLWANISPDATRKVALGTSILTFLLSLAMLANFDTSTSEMQMTEHLTWLPGVGINYDMCVDGLSVLLVVMTTLLSILAILQSFAPINKRVREYFISLLLLETGMIGVFLAIDLFLFYIFWELVLVPMALLIGIWGSANRVYAAVKFFLYTLAGSLLMLVGIVATYQAYFEETGIRTLNVLELANGNYGQNFQLWAFGVFFIAFAIKVPMWPFHTWLPDAHVEAPTAGSVILAGVLLKMVGYALIRFNLSLFPDASLSWAPYIMVLSVIAAIYGALVALVQPDLKKLIAYSSVSHMAFVTMGIFAFNMQGMYGAMIVMLSHGFVTSGLFLCVGVIYDRAHTRDISAFGGLATRMPVYASIFGVFMLASLGLPGLSNFVGEFLAILGAFTAYRWAGIITMSVVILSAWYMMWMFQRVVFERAAGEPRDPGDNAIPAVSGASADVPPPGHPDTPHEAIVPNLPETHVPSDDEILAASKAPNWPDVTPRELATLVPLLILTVVLGVWPQPFMDVMQLTFEAILAPFGSVGV
ncbi:NADH-quinone oxidoreductase subunit M [soil metagenome]